VPQPDRRHALIELVRRNFKDIHPKDSLFDKQIEYRAEMATIKAAICTRRAGKTTEAAVELFEAATAAPYSMNPYIALTRDSAKRIMWPVLEQMNSKYRLGFEPKESSLTLVSPKGSQIFCVGADQKNYIEKLKGLKIKKGVIDECASFKQHIEDLVDTVLEPACADLRGQLSLLGTPGVRPAGYFYDITTQNRGVPVYRWSLLDNPYMPEPETFLKNLMKRKGWTDQNPTYRREYLGEWVLDLDALVYKFSRAKNSYDQLPKDIQLYRVLGIDLGYSPDPTAFAVLVYSPESPDIWIEHTEKHLELTPSDIAEKTSELVKRYSPTNIVADSGALGKSIVAEMVKRYSLPIQAAEKKDKLATQQLMNGDFIDGRLFVNSGQEDLIHQYEILTYGENGLEDASIPNDLCDAALYAWRECKHYAYRPKEAQISRDSDEFMQQYWKSEGEKLERQRSGFKDPLVDEW
jgi:hypothetical protein